MVNESIKNILQMRLNAFLEGVKKNTYGNIQIYFRAWRVSEFEEDENDPGTYVFSIQDDAFHQYIGTGHFEEECFIIDDIEREDDYEANRI